MRGESRCRVRHSSDKSCHSTGKGRSLTLPTAGASPLDSCPINAAFCSAMGRPPLHDKPMTSTERARRTRQRAADVTVRTGRIRRAFEAAGADAQAAFIKWLRRMKLID